MKYMHKVIWEADGDLTLRGNSKALLYRAFQDVRNHLAVHDDAGDAQLRRTLAALEQVLGAYQGELPGAVELLGDPVRQQVARNLLKG